MLAQKSRSLVDCNPVMQIPVASLALLCDPYAGRVWDLEDHEKLRLDRIRFNLENGLTCSRSYSDSEERWTLARHERRVAYFMQRGWLDPIEIDVGVPELHYYPVWMITDGNHRFAAAIALGLTSIRSRIQGSVSLVKCLFNIDLPG